MLVEAERPGTNPLARNLRAQEQSREPGVAKTSMAKLMSFYDFLSSYLAYLIICSASPQQIRNRH